MAFPVKRAAKTSFYYVAPYAKRARTLATSYIKKKAETAFVKARKNVGRKLASRVTNPRAQAMMQALMPDKQLVNTVRALDTTATALATDTFNVVDLTQIVQGTATNQRESNHVFLRDILIKINFINRSGSKQYLNFMMVTTKSVGGAPIASNWFREQGAEENISFTATSLSPFAKHTRDVNDDFQIIHFHKRAILGGAAGTTSNFDNATSNTKMWNFNYSLNTKISYSDKGSGETADFGVYLVYWFNTMGAVSPIVPLAGTMIVERDIQLTFGGE